MQLLKCLETVRKCPLDKARSMQNSADSRIIGDQSILHFPVGVSRSENILESRTCQGTFFYGWLINKPSFRSQPAQAGYWAWSAEGKRTPERHINSVPIKATKALQLSFYPHWLDFWCCLSEPVYLIFGFFRLGCGPRLCLGVVQP